MAAEYVKRWRVVERNGRFFPEVFECGDWIEPDEEEDYKPEGFKTLRWAQAKVDRNCEALLAEPTVRPLPNVVYEREVKYLSGVFK